LQNTPLSVIDAENGQQAVLIAEQYQPNAILMDIRMPVMDGYRAAKQIKENIKLNHIPIIAVTAFGLQEDEQGIMQSGYFNGYLRKPVSRPELFSKLAAFLSHHGISNSSRKAEKKGTIEISPEILENFPEIFDELEKMMLMWESVQGKGNFLQIAEFGSRIKEIGTKYSLIFLEEFGKDILKYTDLFDVENIDKIMKKYPETVSEIRRKTR